MESVEILSGLVKKAASEIVMEPGDYIGADGLAYCGKCHTLKQAQVSIHGVHPMCLCDCAAKRLKEEEQKRKQEEKALAIREMRTTGFPEREMASWTFANDDQSKPLVTSMAKRYVANFKEMQKMKKGILFYGPVGTGKTYIAACIANALIDQGHPCLVTNFSRLANTLFGLGGGKQDYLDSLNAYDLIVFDDYGAERKTDYMWECISSIIDARYRSGKPVIVTTNYPLGEFLSQTCEDRKRRVYSRLMEMTVPFEVRGSDRRMQNSDLSRIRAILQI